MTATLAREAMEESQVLVTMAAYLGYQDVRRGEDRPFAQVRMAGLIDRFGPRAPDPDGGRLLRRFMTSLDNAPAVLGWGEPAVAQAAAAARVAAQLWGLLVTAPAAAGYADLPWPRDRPRRVLLHERCDVSGVVIPCCEERAASVPHRVAGLRRDAQPAQDGAG